QRRGTALLDAMGLTAEERERVHTPAGIEIGAQTPSEIALSILAQVVRAIRVDGLAAQPADTPMTPEQAVDVVCGMTVVIRPETPHLSIGGIDHWFCSAGCRDSFAEQSAP